MNLIELDRALQQLRLGGMAAVLETRLRQAQTEAMAPIDLLSCLASDELTRRSERLLERRRKQAQFRDSQKTLDNFDFNFNKKMNRSRGQRHARPLAASRPRAQMWASKLENETRYDGAIGGKLSKAELRAGWLDHFRQCQLNSTRRTAECGVYFSIAGRYGY